MLHISSYNFEREITPKLCEMFFCLVLLLYSFYENLRDLDSLRAAIENTDDLQLLFVSDNV